MAPLVQLIADVVGLGECNPSRQLLDHATEFNRIGRQKCRHAVRRRNKPPLERTQRRIVGFVRGSEILANAIQVLDEFFGLVADLWPT